MGEDWMDKYLDDLDLKRKQDERRAELEAIARAYGPRVFPQLVEQVRRDVTRYRERSRNTDIQFEAQDSGFVIKNQRYPHFWLRVEVQGAEITWIRTVKRTSSAHEKRDEGMIPMVAKGQDEIYYRWEGRDYATESEISEALLRPLLELLEGT